MQVLQPWMPVNAILRTECRCRNTNTTDTSRVAAAEPSINRAPAGMPRLPRRHRSPLHGERMFAVQGDKRPDAERSGTHMVEPSGAAHEEVGPGVDMDIGQGWGGIDDLGEALLPLVVKYTRTGPWLARMARFVSRETDTGRCYHMRCKPLWPCVRIDVVG